MLAVLEREYKTALSVVGHANEIAWISAINVLEQLLELFERDEDCGSLSMVVR